MLISHGYPGLRRERMKFSIPTLSFECENKADVEDINDDLKREAAL